MMEEWKEEANKGSLEEANDERKEERKEARKEGKEGREEREEVTKAKFGLTLNFSC